MPAGRPIACITFVGDPSTDTRILRTADALRDDYDIHIVTLTHLETPEVQGVIVHPVVFPEGTSLRKTLFPFWKQAAAICASLTPQICVASDLYSLPAAARAAKSTGAPLVYDSRELYGSIAALQGKKLRQRFWNVIERRYTAAAKAILTVNEEIANILKRQYPNVPVHVAYNVPMSTAISDGALLRNEFAIPGGKTVLISNGGLQRGRGLFAMIDLVERLPECHLVFLGDGPLRSELELYAMGGDCSDRVHFKHVPSDDVVKWTSGADIGLCFVENLGLSYYLSLPNKVFEYIHAGIPSVCTDLPVVRSIIEKHDVGTIVPIGNVEKAVDAVSLLIKDRDYYQGFVSNTTGAAEKYSWERERQHLKEIFIGLRPD